MKWKQLIKVRPLAKERPRATRTGHVYTPKRTANYEKQVAEEYKGPFFDESYLLEVSVVCNLEGSTIVITGTKKKNYKHQLRGDVDNYAKSILDALNGVAWEDDSQIVEVTVRKS